MESQRLQWIRIRSEGGRRWKAEASCWRADVYELLTTQKPSHLRGAAFVIRHSFQSEDFCVGRKASTYQTNSDSATAYTYASIYKLRYIAYETSRSYLLLSPRPARKFHLWLRRWMFSARAKAALACEIISINQRRGIFHKKIFSCLYKSERRVFFSRDKDAGDAHALYV